MKDNITFTPLGMAVMEMLSGIAHTVDVMRTNRIEGVDNQGARFVVDIDGPKISVTIDCSPMIKDNEPDDFFDVDGLPPFMD